tara:strand:- start:92 stop:325 length:234 start_codon:yes stop_codon:yes gene_type:complete
MKYINATKSDIFARIDGKTVVVAPNEEINSKTLLPDSGLTPVAPPVTEKVVVLESIKKSKPTPVIKNEFTTTNTSKD